MIFSIRKQYLNYLSQARKKQFEIPKYLELLVDKAIDLFNLSGISCVDMLQYMLEHDINNWVHYYAYTFIIPIAQGKSIECVKDLSDLYALVMTDYILDDFGFNRLNIEVIVKGEQLTHKKNQYGLSVVNGVVFHNDYFVFENKAYLYNILTNIIPVSFGDVMPGFARVISEQREVGNILLRLDDRLALPEEQAISYSTLNFEKYRGPQFHFKDTLLKTSKTISVHFNGKTMDKLLMVVKQKFDEKENKSFWHIELETLPYRNRESKGKYCITTFLHGMYYPDEDIFTHIDSPAEVEEVVEYALLNKDKSIAVITPFVNQKQLIENAIKQNKLSNLVCGTVHAFQGDEKDVVLFSTAISERTSSGTYNWLKNNKELINVATSRAKEKLVLLTNGKELERLHAGQADDDLYELAQYIKTNGHSKITEKHISSRALGIQPFSTATENAFLENLTHALENIWLSQSKYVIHKEVAISQVFRDNITYDDLFYMGRFDFVVYEKQGRSELPILAIELDGKEHFEDAVVKERDRKKNAICKAHNMEIIRVENSYARRYNHIKGILMDYFSRVH